MSEQRITGPITRREALKRGLLGAAGLTLFGHRSVWAQAEAAGVRPPDKPARAKAVIQIWMWGGPSHLDTFDPKPDAGYDYCGPLNKPIPTNVDGIRIGELLPLLAQQADKYSIIRSMTHGVNSHETAAYIVQTGHKPDSLVYPSVGAVVSLFKGYDHGYAGLIPPYIVLTTAQGRFSEAGFLGQRYKPFATGGDPNLKRFAVEGIVAQGISDQRQRDRRELLHTLDSLGKAMPANPQFERLDRCEEKAYDLILGDAGKLFDLSEEKDEIRDRYGRNTFGQSCLMARRLVEHGVPYVTINYKGWDTHKQHFEIMRRKLPEMDKGMVTLLQDLTDRGLLDSTIIWWSGEFGRTPKVQWEPPWNGGRGHYGNCFCAVLAGGGFKGGRVVGASDAKGEEVAERPVHPQDLLASMYELLGIDPDGPLPNPRGLDIKVMPSAGRLEELV
jgi:acetyl esterase/lipase